MDFGFVFTRFVMLSGFVRLLLMFSCAVMLFCCLL
jgi:hypothetical protein